LRSSITVLGLAVLGGAFVVGLAGCPENKYDPNTWISKLDDPKELDRAVTELQNLCDPRAITPLGNAWKKNSKPTRILQVIIDLSRPMSAGPGGEADTKNCTDFIDKGRFVSDPTEGWKQSLPFLQEAIEDIDSNSQRQIDDAVKAAEALGDAQLPDAAQILVNAINKKMTAKDNAQRLRLTAIVALAKYKDPGTQKLAIQTLGNVIKADQTSQPPNVVGAAINALGDMHTADTLPILLDAMYRVPLFFQQVQRALVNGGGDVVAQLKLILEGKQNDINALFKDKKLDKYCGDKNDAAPSDCQDVSAMDYYASIVLGDLYDKSAVPDLLTALARPAKPAYFSNYNAGPPAQNSILDSLRKIGDPSSAQAILNLWANEKTDEQLRPMAAGVYGFVSKDGSEKYNGTSGLDVLAKIAADDKADTALRLSASESYGRLASDKSRIDLLKKLAKNYADASAKARKEAEGDPKVKLDAAKKQLDVAQKAFDEANKPIIAANGKVEELGQDVIDAQKKAKDNLDLVNKGTYIPAKEKYDSLDQRASGLQGYERGFEDHIARIEIAVTCGKDAKCYADALDADPKKIFERLKSSGYLDATAGDWSADDLADLKSAEVERAVLELRRMGKDAAGQLPKLLDHVKDTDRIQRQAIMMAIPQIASLPCPDCEKKLNEAVTAGQGHQELSELTYETQLMAGYYAWAGKK